MKLKNISLSTRIIGSALIAVIAVTAMLIYIEYARDRDAYLNEQRINMEDALNAEELHLHQTINTLHQDVLFMSNTPPVSGIVRAVLNHGYDPIYGNTFNVWTERLQQISSAFSKAHPSYCKISFIGVADGGREIVRIDNRGGEIEITRPERLQAKGNQDYFKAALGLHKGQVHLSNFNLNQEWGAIEYPYLPAFRAITPVFTSSGKIFGMVMISIDARDLLTLRKHNFAQNFQAYITNSDGQYLLHPNPHQAFTFEIGGKDNILTDNPSLKVMFNQQTADYLPMQTNSTNTGGQYWAAKRVRFDPSDTSRFLLLAYAIPGNLIEQHVSMMPMENIVIGFFIMLLISGTSIVALRRTFAPLKNIAEAAGKIASGELNIQLPQEDGGEIGSLTKSINAMLLKVMQREQEIMQINASLEKRVEERTKELEEKITENEQSTLALQESESHLSQAQSIAHIGSWYFDLKSSQLRWSDELYRIFGVSPETFIPDTENFIKLLHPDDQPAMLEWIDDCAMGKKPGALEFRCKLSDGSIRHINGQGDLIHVNGKPSRLSGTAQDITERKQAEAQIAKYLSLLNATLESTNDAILVVDLNNLWLLHNKRFIDMWHIPDEIIMKEDDNAALEYVLDQLKDKIEFLNKVRELYATPEASSFDILEFKDGRIIERYSIPQYIDSAVVGRVWSFRDITKRNKDEEQLRIAAVAFETHEAIIITDADANIFRVNRAFTDITGYTLEDVQHKNLCILGSDRHDVLFYETIWHQILNTGSWVGEMWDSRKNGQIYPKWQSITAVKNGSGIITGYVAIFNDITERKKNEEEIHKLAFYDSLTKLPNRRLFLDRFDTALIASARYNNFGAVLFIDLDRFKLLNDTLGHDYGDMLLIEVAVRIKACVREVDTVARLGGDEFVALIENISNDQHEASLKVGVVAEKIRESLACPYNLNGHEHHSSPSIGVSLYHGNEETIEELLHHADMAMYQAKDSGRNAVRFFDPVMQNDVATRAALVNDLRSAIVQQQFHLYYQLQVDNDNNPVGAEALLRWIHPQRGMVMPEKFLPIAEGSTLILDICALVLEAACRQLALWNANEKMRHLVLTVNISAKQFAMPDFVEKIASALQTHQINPARLKLELTENIALDNLSYAVEKMLALKALGVLLSMDDFGTRYSSLSNLKQLPLDQLKLGRNFVHDVAIDGNVALLVQSIIDLSSKFRISVIAEGVENEAQLTSLKDRDCVAYQGFLFSEALSIDEFEKLLK